MDEVRMTVRLPMDAAQFLTAEARAHFTSRNAQIVRAIRAAIKAKGPAEAATSPSHGSDNPLEGKADEHV